MDTKLSIEEIEVALAESRDFHYARNTVVFNVYGLSEILPIQHECDVIVMSKAGYLTEIEIKRSWNDFLADFKKEHHHDSEYIKGFYYCVPFALAEKVREHLKDTEMSDAGIIAYHEDGYMQVVKYPKERTYPKKLFIEQRMELMRLGVMRVVTLKKKLINTNKTLFA